MATYVQWLANVDNDPFRPSYLTVLNCFKPGNNVPEDILLEQALRNPNVPQTFITTTNAEAGYHLFMLHRPTYFVMYLDGTPTPWDNQIFTYKGDVMYSMNSVFEFPPDPFQITTANHVSVMEMIMVQLNQQNQLQLVMPMEAEVENTDQLVTWKIMYLPAKYASLLLDAQGYMPWEAWM